MAAANAGGHAWVWLGCRSGRRSSRRRYAPTDTPPLGPTSAPAHWQPPRLTARPPAGPPAGPPTSSPARRYPPRLSAGPRSRTPPTRSVSRPALPPGLAHFSEGGTGSSVAATYCDRPNGGPALFRTLPELGAQPPHLARRHRDDHRHGALRLGRYGDRHGRGRRCRDRAHHHQPGQPLYRREGRHHRRRHDAAATATVTPTGMVTAVTVHIGGAGYTAPTVTFGGIQPGYGESATRSSSLLTATDSSPYCSSLCPSRYLLGSSLASRPTPTPQISEAFRSYVLRPTGKSTSTTSFSTAGR